MIQASLYPNIGAESGEEHADQPGVRLMAELFRQLFEPPAFEWIDPALGHAWLNTAEAAAWAKTQDVELAGAPPEIVARLVDKAWALEVAADRGLVPEPLHGLVFCVDAGELSVEAIQAGVDAWPQWARRDFTVKPRVATSARGRVAGREGRADTPHIRGSIPRWRDCDGVVVEPWLDRCGDYSAQFFVESPSAVHLLGTLEQRLTPAGQYEGHRGRVAADGSVCAASAWDEQIAEAGEVIARAAAEAGYRGPCGVDAFAFELDGETWLRPVVELNARYTTGTITIGLIRRLAAGESARFEVDVTGRLEGAHHVVTVSPAEARYRLWRDAPPG